MKLSTWEAMGVDVSAFASVSLFEDGRTGVLHSDIFCDAYTSDVFCDGVADPSARAVKVRLTPSVSLCDACWADGLPEHPALVYVQMMDADQAETLLARARSFSLSGKGFSLLVAGLRELPEGAEVAGRVERMRSEVLAEFEAEFPEGRPAPRSAVSGREGFLHVPQLVSYQALAWLDASAARLAALWWEGDWPGYAARGPLEVLEHLAALLLESLPPHYSAAVSVTELLSADTLVVFDTAKGLYDPDSEVFSRVDTLFEAARAV